MIEFSSAAMGSEYELAVADGDAEAKLVRGAGIAALKLSDQLPSTGATALADACPPPPYWSPALPPSTKALYSQSLPLGVALKTIRGS